MVKPPENRSKASKSLDIMLLEKEQMIQQQSVVIDKKSEVIEHQKQRIALLEEALRLDKARLFGLKSEKNQDQGELFDEAELCSEEQPDLGVSDMPKRPKPTGRKGLSKSLPRQQIKHCLSDDEKAGAIDTFFKLAREELDITPAKACVIEQRKITLSPQGCVNAPERSLPITIKHN